MIANDLHFGGAGRRARAQALVNSILGATAPRVYVQGSRFVHRATWMDRALIGIVCAWARLNPKKRPGPAEAAAWSAETHKIHRKLEIQGQDCIVLAALPAMGDRDLDVVSDGGALHETAHGLYTRRHPYTDDEVMRLIVDRWDEIPDWGFCERALLDITNVVDDPRIERALMLEYPGTTPYIWALRRWSWSFEARTLEEVCADPEKSKAVSPYQVATSLLIALGHDGVEVPERADYIEVVRRVRPAVAAVVEHGMLSEIMEAMRAVATDDHDAPLRIAIRFVSLVAEALGEEEEIPLKLPGCPGALACPQCGSTNVRAILLPSTPQDQASGSRRASCTCGACGTMWSTRVQPCAGEGGDSIVIDLDDVADTIQELAAERAAQGKDEKDSKKGGKKKSKNSKKGEGKQKPGDKNGKTPQGRGEKPEESTGSKPNEAGKEPGAAPEEDVVPEIAGEALGRAGEDSTPVVVIADIMDGFVDKVWDEQDQGAVGAPYRPYAPGNDEVVVSEPNDRAAALAHVTKLRDEAAAETQTIREGLRRLVVSMRRSRTLHGVEHGTDLSERRLADVGASLLVGEYPQRPWKRRIERPDPRFSAIVVLDQSSSMAGWIVKATQVMLAIVDPIDDLGYPVAAIGFQDKATSRDDVLPSEEGDQEGCHRSDWTGVRVHLYKRFQEPLSLVQHRFATARADGGTPMAEGVQAALEWISVRREATRFIFVVTDGCPNGGTSEVIVRQVAEAVRRKILIVGVGVGPGTEGAVKLFHPTGVSVKTLGEVPDVLLRIIAERLRAL